MINREKKGWVVGLIIAVIIVSAPFIYRTISGIMTPDVEDVRKVIENDLYRKYGEEFIVDNIGTRTAVAEKFYEARIYPKSIIGTKKQGDSEYYSDATVDILSFGKLGPVSDGYGMIMAREELEEYLYPKAKDLFGKMVRIKSDFKYKKRKENGDFGWYIPPDFKSTFEKVKGDPENQRFELELYLYIFDRIDDEEEKETRRKQIFDFVQYLKEEGLFEYLEMGVIFIDERVLAPSYDEYRHKIFLADSVEKRIGLDIIYLPPMELREEMSEVLEEEVDKMSEEELLASMRKIRKSELDFEGIRKYNTQFMEWIISIGMMKENRKNFYQRKKKSSQLNNYYYDSLNNIDLSSMSDYIYVN